jgi:hypothetical protein
VKRKGGGVLAVVGPIFIGFVILVANADDKPAASSAAIANAPTPAPTCKTDWHQCRDNTDLVENSNLIIGAQIACKSKANELAKYGDPEWPWLPFGTYFKGSEAPKTGILRLVEKEAKFQNAFSAMAHVAVDCTYDLGNNSVINVAVDQ